MKMNIKVIVVFLGCISCLSNRKIKIIEIFTFKQIPVENSIFINKDNLYFTNIDLPLNKYQVKCIDLLNHKIKWDIDCGDRQIITHGIIDDSKNYIIPTLSNNVLVIDTNGKLECITLTDRCKISPIKYKNQIIVHDRGVGLRSFDTKTHKEVWRIKQSTHNSISQPFQINEKLYFILDDKTLFSVNPNNGNNNWSKEIQVDRISHIYNCDSQNLVILSIDLENRKYLSMRNTKNGELVWEKQVESDFNIFERDNCILKNKIYCRGKETILVYDILDGKFDSEIKINEELKTNIVKDSKENIYYALSNRRLVKFNTSTNKKEIFNVENEINRFYKFDNKIYCYSHPKIFFVE